MSRPHNDADALHKIDTVYVIKQFIDSPLLYLAKSAGVDVHNLSTHQICFCGTLMFSSRASDGEDVISWVSGFSQYTCL